MKQILTNKILLALIILLLFSVLILFIFYKLHKNNNKSCEKPAQEFIEDIPPTEDLMREHGLLNRVLLIYEEIVKRLDKNKDFNINNLKQAALVIRNFIEDYHEKLEEKYIFSRFQQNGKMLELVNSLIEQHEAGRILTSTIIDLADINKFQDLNNKQKLSQTIKSFIVMYRVHESREDTELFSEFRKLITQSEFDQLSEIFESTENEKFGKDGFERILHQIEIIEKELDIYDIDKFTPRA